MSLNLERNARLGGGALPADLGDLCCLAQLSAYSTKLEGRLPPSLSRLRRLQCLRLNNKPPRLPHINNMCSSSRPPPLRPRLPSSSKQLINKRRRHSGSNINSNAMRLLPSPSQKTRRPSRMSSRRLPRTQTP